MLTITTVKKQGLIQDQILKVRFGQGNNIKGVIMKKTFIWLMLSAILCTAVFGQQVSETSFKIIYEIGNSADYIGNRYISYKAQHPTVLTFVNSDGSVTVCSSNRAIQNYDFSKNDTIVIVGQLTFIYEYDINLKEQKKIIIINEFENLGAFTKDNDGNYYFFFAEDTNDKNKENMAIVKFDREGKEIKTYKIKADTPNGFGGVKKPFDAGTCRLELSGNLLAVYFARERFDGHQSSYGFVFDKNTFERIDKGHCYYFTNGTYPNGNNLLPLSGHSFNQFILPIENGFIFVDHADGVPRSFTFGKFQNGSSTKRLNAFTFPGGEGQNPTYAEMGGLAKTSTGYIFAGAYGRERNNPRNLFVLTFDEDMKACSSPIYLTNYTAKDGHVGHPKIVAIDNGRYLLLWELFKFSTEYANVIGTGTSDYISTYMLIIDENGKAVSDVKELKNVRLNMNDTLRYNSHNGKVYWAINEGDMVIKIYAVQSE